MKDVKSLKPQIHIVKGLKLLITAVETGEIVANHCTVVIGDEVHHFSQTNVNIDKADAVFNLNYGLHRLVLTGFD